MEKTYMVLELARSAKRWSVSEFIGVSVGPFLDVCDCEPPLGLGRFRFESHTDRTDQLFWIAARLMEFVCCKIGTDTQFQS